MPPPSITLQPYDRDTGSELSPQEQAACQSNYAIIKVYIDRIESRREPPPPWIRKKVRCSTTEFIDSVSAFADAIGQRHEKVLSLDLKHSNVYTLEVVEHDVPVDSFGLDAQEYQQARNLLHELVSRLADVSNASQRALLESSHSIERNLALGSIANSSESSAAPSKEMNSRTSHVTSETGQTHSSILLDHPTSRDVGPIMHTTPEESHHVSFEHGMSASLVPESPLAYDEARMKATGDWVLEYLRGGWITNSLATMPEPNTTPVLPMAGDTSPAGSFRRLYRTDSDELSASEEEKAARIRHRGGFTSSRAPRSSRPIPTMASRFKGKTTRSSIASGPDFFKTPRSIMSGNTIYHTPDSGSNNSGPLANPRTSAWNAYLRYKGLIPNPFEEMNWSGRGQHAEFETSDEVPLIRENVDPLGYSTSAIVESVRCRRIRLARKTVRVSRRLKKEEAIKEVEHLQRLKHPHIIRVIGTYTLPQKLAILLYPVADYTMDQFLESVGTSKDRSARLYSVSTFLRCLAKAMSYIHDQAIKHMDIKPKNLLVRNMRDSIICNQGLYKVYIADFGIARAYRSVEDCDTESPTAYTKMYAAPEVVAQERRDQKADIFSLGAVYAEMLSVLADEENGITNSDILFEIRERNPQDKSYQENATIIQTWLRGLTFTTYGFESDTNHSHISELVARMLSIDAAARPTASTIVENIPFSAFCCDVNGGPEPFEAADRPSNRQLYDRAIEISEADLTCFRCMVDGCVKVYWSREKLEYHTHNGHGEGVESLTATGKLLPILGNDSEEQLTSVPYQSDDISDTISQDYKALHKEITANLRWT
ncbi:kinase-like domain-containing protein [Lophiotrema nucula]|uniref:Kinase-like domain-containing protein n=1 Tax=Lophiotrema nucula TaxID=690887 RepID=A0A6A5ZRK1_9PLEO|nr:kinase-like domain-containing protein [Lophiotrema nucula]